jgi:hypothetical protein
MVPDYSNFLIFNNKSEFEIDIDIKFDILKNEVCFSYISMHPNIN